VLNFFATFRVSGPFPRRVLCAALFVVLVLASPAAADRRVKITGGGWGQGIGMSQYGAYGRALNGKSGVSIVNHYYSRSDVHRRQMPNEIRVGLLQGRGLISLYSKAHGSGGGRVVFKVAGASAPLAEGGAGSSWRLEPTRRGRIHLYKNGRLIRKNGRSAFGNPKAPLHLIYARHASLVHVNQKGLSYGYGHLVFDPYSSSSCGGYCLRLVLSISMQKYLYGLGEVPASWPDAALSAQTIVARTYAFEKIRRLGQHREVCDCAVYDSAIDQVYLGDAKRTGSGSYWDDWKGAVNRTAGKVVLHGGVPIQALYSSSSGGHTENNENVWGGTPLPYLRGVNDRADAVRANPNHRWRLSMSWSSFSSRLNAYYGTGRLRRFRLVRPFGVSGRVTVVKPGGGGAKVVGSNRTVRTSGYVVKSALGLKDTLFRVQIISDSGTTGSVLSSQSGSYSEVTPVTSAVTRASGSGPALSNAGPVETD
jgi:SpoIID/LytB domain protein